MSEALEVEGEEQSTEQSIEQESTTEEDVARESGWKPEGEWDDDDPNRPHKFTSAETFNARKELIKEIRVQKKRVDDLETNFNTRLDNSNKLHQQQMNAQKAELVRKRDEAIDLADRETANQIQGDIDNLNVPVEPAVNTQQSALDNWNQSNPWIFQGGPKSAYAQSQLNLYLQQNQPVSAALSNVDADIAREFPAINPNRENHPSSEGGSKPGGKRATQALTMADLTHQEQNIYNKMPGTWESEAVFLKAVQDSRSAT